VLLLSCTKDEGIAIAFIGKEKLNCLVLRHVEPQLPTELSH